VEEFLVITTERAFQKTLSVPVVFIFVECSLGAVDFWIFWIFNFLQFAIDGKNNSKTKVANVFFFIFLSSYAEMSFLKIKNHQIG
jgi:hypothetical protein